MYFTDTLTVTLQFYVTCKQALTTVIYHYMPAAMSVAVNIRRSYKQ